MGEQTIIVPGNVALDWCFQSIVDSCFKRSACYLLLRVRSAVRMDKGWRWEVTSTVLDLLWKLDGELREAGEYKWAEMPPAYGMGWNHDPRKPL